MIDHKNVITMITLLFILTALIPGVGADPFNTSLICGGAAVNNKSRFEHNSSADGWHCFFELPTLEEVTIITEERGLLKHRWLDVPAARSHCGRYSATFPIILNGELLKAVHEGAKNFRRTEVPYVPIGIHNWTFISDSQTRVSVTWDTRSKTTHDVSGPLFEGAETWWDLTRDEAVSNRVIFSTMQGGSWVAGGNESLHSLLVLCHQNLTKLLNPVIESTSASTSTRPVTDVSSSSLSSINPRGDGQDPSPTHDQTTLPTNSDAAKFESSLCMLLCAIVLVFKG